MKIRDGFVSNSSSSSFIIGLGIIKDETKLDKFLRSLPDSWENGSWTIHSFTGDKKETLTDIFIEDESRDLLSVNDKYVSIEAPTNSSPLISIPKEEVKGKKVFAYVVGNNEGDGAFASADDDYSYDLQYSKADNPDYFTGVQRQLLGLFMDKNDMLENTVYRIGAERNG